MEVYTVWKIDKRCDGTYYKDIIAIFETKKDAEKYCLERYLTSVIGNDWPRVIITKQQVKLRTD